MNLMRISQKIIWLLYCIDETGNEVCKLSEEFKSPSEVINGYSVVDQKYVVDIHGNILYTIDDSERMMGGCGQFIMIQEMN